MVPGGRNLGRGWHPGSGYVTATLSGVPRTDIRRLHIPVLPIETQRFYGKAYRRLAEFETLVAQAAERSSDIARELASGLVNQALEPEPGQARNKSDLAQGSVPPAAEGTNSLGDF